MSDKNPMNPIYLADAFLRKHLSVDKKAAKRDLREARFLLENLESIKSDLAELVESINDNNLEKIIDLRKELDKRWGIDAPSNSENIKTLSNSIHNQTYELTPLIDALGWQDTHLVGGKK